MRRGIDRGKSNQVDLCGEQDNGTRSLQKLEWSCPQSLPAFIPGAGSRGQRCTRPTPTKSVIGIPGYDKRNIAEEGEE
jgi:hypothetical protein